MKNSYQYKPVRYFLFTFLITFVLWFVGAYLSFQEGGEGLSMALVFLGLMVPFIISTIMIFRSKNAALKKEFWNRLTNFKLIRPKMLPILFLIMPITMLLAVLISLPLGGSISQLQWREGFSFSFGAYPVFFGLIIVAVFEEVGWRGYAFDSLQSKFNFFWASIIFSVLWAFWHFPLMFVKDFYQYEVLHQNPWYAVNFFASIIPMGIIISWICVKNGKSVIAAIVFHFVINMAQELLSVTQATKSIETGVLFVIAIAIIIYDKELFFSKKHFSKETKPISQVANSDNMQVTI